MEIRMKIHCWSCSIPLSSFSSFIRLIKKSEEINLLFIRMQTNTHVSQLFDSLSLKVNNERMNNFFVDKSSRSIEEKSEFQCARWRIIIPDKVYVIFQSINLLSRVCVREEINQREIFIWENDWRLFHRRWSRRFVVFYLPWNWVGRMELFRREDCIEHLWTLKPWKILSKEKNHLVDWKKAKEEHQGREIFFSIWELIR